MKKFLQIFLVFSLFYCSSYVKAQSYCIQFSKEKKKSIIIEAGKKVSFVIKYNEDWEKGMITKITADSLFIEQERPKKDMLAERENNYEIIGYAAKDFKMMAYPKTSAIVKGTVISTLLLATFIFIYTIPIEDDGGKPNKQWFKKNIDFEDGWKAEVVSCTK